jgi:hypothetical protein
MNKKGQLRLNACEPYARVFLEDRQLIAGSFMCLVAGTCSGHCVNIIDALHSLGGVDLYTHRPY